MNGGQRKRILGIGQRFSDSSLLQSRQHHDFPGVGAFDFDALQSLIQVEVTRFNGDDLAIVRDAGQRRAGVQRTGSNPSRCRHTAVGIIAQRGHEHLERRLWIDMRRRDAA